MSEGPGVIRPSGERGAPVPGAGRLGLAVFLTSLSVFFGGLLVAVIVVQRRSHSWPPADAPELPGALWLATALLAAGSIAMQLGMRGIRGGSQRALMAGLGAALVSTVLFAGTQVWNWVHFYLHDTTFSYHLYGFSFYGLTGLHAVHVLGGAVALGWVYLRARRGAYDWSSYAGVRYVTVYWHFLGVVWLVVFLFLLWN